MKDVERLLAIEEIKQLKARYFLYVDTKKWRDLEALFTEDARMDTEGRDVLRDRDTFVSYVSRLFADAVTIHRGSMPMITVSSANSASGIWSMDDRLWFPGTADGAPRYWQGSGYYHETYTCIEGNWRIQSLKLVRLRLESFNSESDSL